MWTFDVMYGGRMDKPQHIPLSPEQEGALTALGRIDHQIKSLRRRYDSQLKYCIELGVPYVHMGEALEISDAAVRQYAKRRGFTA